MIKIPKDKLDHFMYWLAGTLGLGIITANITITIGIMVIAGILKEVYDIYYGTCDMGDLIADWIGVIVGALVLCVK
jgi:hypothetical protein